MLVDEIELTIEGQKIPNRFIKSLETNSSRIERPSTLKVELVKKLGRYTNLYKKKNKVILSACYKDRYPLTNLFSGIITKPNLEQDSLTLDCEDYSYLLSKEIRTVTFRKLFDGEIIKRLAGNFGSVENVQNRRYYRKISFTLKSIRYIINKLTQMSLSDWFYIGDKLMFGAKYTFTKEKDLYIIDLDAPYIVDNALEWHEGIAGLKVIVIGTNEKGKTYVGKYGKGKNVRRFFEKDSGKDSVGDKAKEHYEELSFRGYKGTLKLLLEPVLTHSQIIGITNNDNERTAYIDSARYTWSQSDGLRQEIKIGQEEKEKKKPKSSAKRRRRRRKRRKKIRIPIGARTK